MTHMIRPWCLILAAVLFYLAYDVGGFRIHTSEFMRAITVICLSVGGCLAILAAAIARRDT